MFNPDGEMKIAKSKSILKQKLQVVVSERNCPFQNTVIYDVSALLWVIAWPSEKLYVYVETFKEFVYQALQRANVTLDTSPAVLRHSHECREQDQVVYTT